MSTGEFDAGGNPGMDLAFHPWWSRNTPCRFMLQKAGIGSGLMAPLSLYADYQVTLPCVYEIYCFITYSNNDGTCSGQGSCSCGKCYCDDTKVRSWFVIRYLIRVLFVDSLALSTTYNHGTLSGVRVQTSHWLVLQFRHCQCLLHAKLISSLIPFRQAIYVFWIVSCQWHDSLF